MFKSLKDPCLFDKGFFVLSILAEHLLHDNFFLTLAIDTIERVVSCKNCSIRTFSYFLLLNNFDKS